MASSLFSVLNILAVSLDEIVLNRRRANRLLCRGRRFQKATWLSFSSLCRFLIYIRSPSFHLSASSSLSPRLPGPPGSPTSIQVEEITDTTVTLSWRPGTDNHSPITAYTIQARTPFSLGWQGVSTGKLSPTSRGLFQSHRGACSLFGLSGENVIFSLPCPNGALL